MKLNRLVTVGAVIALVAGSSLFTASAANAADSYITANQFGAEGATYPAGWFVGSGSAGSMTTTTSGLSVVGRMQLLNGTPSTVPADGLVGLANGADIGVVSGNANFQIPLFTNAGGANTGFTTLRPDNFNNPGLNPLAGWTTSGTFGTFAAGSSHTLGEYDTQLASLPNYQLLAFGVIVPLGQVAVLSHITWNGNTTWFTPQPTATASPTSISATDFGTASKGVTVHLTGFVPGETVTPFFASTSSGSSLPGSYVADAGGTVTFTYVYPNTTLAPGTYVLGGQGTSGVIARAAFTVVADPAAPATPVAGNAHFTG